MKKSALLLSLLLSLNFLFAQTKVNDHTKESLVKWYTLEEAMELTKKNPKKIFIDVYTDWCGWCKRMDQVTFNDPTIAAYLNQNFYPVKFDAETKDTITYLGDEYVSNGEGRRPTNKLAIKLLNGKMSYPTVVLLDEKGVSVGPVPGFLDPGKIQPILIYFAENIYKTTPHDLYTKYFNDTFHDTIPEDDVQNIIWYDINEALALAKKNPKKILVQLYTDYSHTSQMMNKTTFNNTEIAKYINETYYPVRFNALSKDSVVFAGNTMVNFNDKHPFHQFGVTLSNGVMSFPNTIFIGADEKLITAVPGYMSPMHIEPVIKFFGDDKHLTSKWEEYVKTFKGTVKNEMPPPPPPKQKI